MQFLDNLSFGNALGKNRYGELWDRLITICTHLTWQSKCSFCIKVFLKTLHIKFSCNLAFLHSQKALAFCQMVSYKCWLLIIWHFNNLAVFWSGYFSNGYLTSGVLSYGEFETGDISEQPIFLPLRNGVKSSFVFYSFHSLPGSKKWDDLANQCRKLLWFFI